MQKITQIFQEFLNNNTIFKNHAALQTTFQPQEILHREQQTEEIAKILAPALKGIKPSNLFISGKPGTGKTLATRKVATQLKNLADEQKTQKIKTPYVNCKLKKCADTEYRLIAQILFELNVIVPTTGLPTQDLYRTLQSTLEKRQELVILVLDEIDELVEKAGDNALYNLTRINSELSNSQVSIVGISNNTGFIANLDPRIKSSLGEEEVFFPQYNALQLKDILLQRAHISINQNAFDEGVISKIAAAAAQEHGDARRAIEILRLTAELASRQKSPRMLFEHVDQAMERYSNDQLKESLQNLSRHAKLLLFTIMAVLKNQKTLYTKDLYSKYNEFCKNKDLRPLTLRRTLDYIGELNHLGLISTKNISRGRHGRTKEITSFDNTLCLLENKKIIEEGLELA